MATDQLLMGLGLPPMLATRLADTSGSILVAGAGTSTTTAYQIRGTQFVIFINSGATTNWVALPSVGGSDNAAQVADQFVIHNGNATSATIGIPTGVTVNIGSTGYTGNYTLTTLKTLNLWPVSNTQWFGISA